MEPLMGDPGPRHPDVNDGAPTAADDASTLVLGSCFVLEIAPADTSRGDLGGDAAAAREAAAHYGSWSELRGGGRRREGSGLERGPQCATCASSSRPRALSPDLR